MKKSGEACQADDYFLLGRQAIEAKEWDKAITLFCECIREKPDNAEAYHNLGYIFEQRDKLDEAEAFFLKAIEIAPLFAKAYYNLGLVYDRKRLWSDAEFCMRRALELAPDSSEILNSLGIVLESLYRFAEAEACYREAVKNNPYLAVAYYNLGLLLKNQQRFLEAEACVKHAVGLCPGSDDLEIGLAFFYLLQGRYEEGWQEYGKICRRNSGPEQNLGCRHWFGENLENCKILLYYGKGLGDSLQFVRYVSQIAKKARETVLLVQPALKRLFAANYPSLKVYADENALFAAYDYACSLQALPIIFRSDDKTIPCKASYLSALPEDIRAWQDFFKAYTGKYQVGVVWAGNPKNPLDSCRSISFKVFSRLFSFDKVYWFSLQVGEHAAELSGQSGIVDLSPRLTDFAETAAVIHNLDLVITMDTSVAHLAGAMGKETWLLLDVNSDWRWQMNREDSPWYAAMRLFRQKQAGDWDDVLKRVLVSLHKLVSEA